LIQQEPEFSLMLSEVMDHPSIEVTGTTLRAISDLGKPIRVNMEP